MPGRGSRNSGVNAFAAFGLAREGRWKRKVCLVTFILMTWARLPCSRVVFRPIYSWRIFGWALQLLSPLILFCVWLTPNVVQLIVNNLWTCVQNFSSIWCFWKLLAQKEWALPADFHSLILSLTMHHEEMAARLVIPVTQVSVLWGWNFGKFSTNPVPWFLRSFNKFGPKLWIWEEFWCMPTILPGTQHSPCALSIINTLSDIA